MSVKRGYGWLFPLALAALMGGLSAWLERISEVVVEETVLNPKEPQYAMQGIAGIRFDSSGQVKETLSAREAWQLPNSDDVVFAAPELRLYRQGQVVYEVYSREARYHTETRKVLFQNDVVLTKAADAQRPAGELKTAALTVDTETEQAYTDLPVDYRYGDSSGTANGLTYDHQKGLLNLPSRVKATIYDPR